MKWKDLSNKNMKLNINLTNRRSMINKEWKEVTQEEIYEIIRYKHIDASERDISVFYNFISQKLKEKNND